MRELSYFGATQWQAATMQHSALRALTLGIAPGEHHNGVAFRGGAGE